MRSGTTETQSTPTAILLLALLLSLFYTAGSAVAEALPEISLTVPEDQKVREYLGIEGAPGDVFQLSDIKTDILLIELFSMYCPYCQAEAPRVNDFHELARGLEKEGITVKVVGLGASNTQFEVDYFRDTYGIAFPLFPDKNLAMYKTLKGDGTPTFLGCFMNAKEGPEIVVREPGGFDSPESFLTLLLQRSGYR